MSTDVPKSVVVAVDVKRSYVGDRCGYCSKSQSELQRKPLYCSICRLAVYCDAECQRLAWPLHKKHCVQRRRKFDATLSACGVDPAEVRHKRN